MPARRDDLAARSPLPVRREELPRDDLFRREPERRDYGRDRDFREERSYRDERDYRDERRDDRAYAAARSPPRYRDRSPLPLKRTREPSPMDSRGRRTPPPAKRERLMSPGGRGRYDDYPPSRTSSPPRRAYSPRPRSPAPRGVTRGYRRADSRSPLRRNDRALDPRDVSDWRRPPPRSPTPPRARATYDDYDDRGRESVATSRRSSPPVHPSRLAIQTPGDDRTSRPAPRDPYESRDPYPARSPPRRELSPLPAREREYDDRIYDREDRIPPPREPYRADDATVRAPPTGPSAGGYRAPSNSMAPPTGPAAAAAGPISAHARAPPAAPPSGPRGDMGPRGGFGGPRGRGAFGGDFAPRGRGGPGFGGPGFRGGRGGGPPPGGFGRGQGYEREQQDFSHQQQGPPSGPRGSFSSQGPPTPFRQNSNATATTYPRTQRFAGNGAPSQDPPTGPRASSTSVAQQPYRRPTEPSIPTGPASSSTNNLPPPTGPAARRRDSDNVHPALRDLPKIIPGGQKASPVIDRSRLDKLGEETERLRKAIEERETKKRKVLRDWERMERESENAALRSQLAEDSVRGFLEEEGVGSAF